MIEEGIGNIERGKRLREEARFLRTFHMSDERIAECLHVDLRTLQRMEDRANARANRKENESDRSPY